MRITKEGGGKHEYMVVGSSCRHYCVGWLGLLVWQEEKIIFFVNLLRKLTVLAFFFVS